MTNTVDPSGLAATELAAAIWPGPPLYLTFHSRAPPGIWGRAARAAPVDAEAGRAEPVAAGVSPRVARAAVAASRLVSLTVSSLLVTARES